MVKNLETQRQKKEQMKINEQRRRKIIQTKEKRYRFLRWNKMMRKKKYKCQKKLMLIWFLNIEKEYLIISQHLSFPLGKKNPEYYTELHSGRL